jgi:hypothetical protein
VLPRQPVSVRAAPLAYPLPGQPISRPLALAVSLLEVDWPVYRQGAGMSARRPWMLMENINDYHSEFLSVKLRRSPNRP